MTSEKSSEMARRGRIGAWRLYATHDAREVTGPARRAFDERFYNGIPEDLPLEERDHRAMYARRAYFAALSRRGVQARQRTARSVRPVATPMPLVAPAAAGAISCGMPA